MQGARLAIPRAKAAIAEATSRMQEKKLAFRAGSRTELNEVKAELGGLEQLIRVDKDKVKRTDVRAPLRGIVKQINVKILGGVIKPGMDLMEIVPIEETLLVEARIKPSDIGFIRKDLPATVKLSAYDFSIYGGLDGFVENISPSTIKDEKTDEDFYKIVVRTDRNSIEHKGKVLPIIPGMVANIDILTGRKTVLDYIAKPIMKGVKSSMSER